MSAGFERSYQVRDRAGDFEVCYAIEGYETCWHPLVSFPDKSQADTLVECLRAVDQFDPERHYPEFFTDLRAVADKTWEFLANG